MRTEPQPRNIGCFLLVLGWGAALCLWLWASFALSETSETRWLWTRSLSGNGLLLSVGLSLAALSRANMDALVDWRVLHIGHTPVNAWQARLIGLVLLAIGAAGLWQLVGQIAAHAECWTQTCLLGQ